MGTGGSRWLKALNVAIVLSLVAVAALTFAATSVLAASGPKVGNIDAASIDEEKLLQFTSAGHVLGFAGNSVIIASARQMLQIKFLNSNKVAPEADGDVLIESNADAHPLNLVTYRNLWDGVTVFYETSEGAVAKSTFYVEDGSRVDRIRLGYNRPVQIDEAGNLVITYETGTMVEGAPVAWQETEDGRQPVTAAYVQRGEREVGFSLRDYLPDLPVVIDPTLTWNSFLGGSAADGDDGYGIAVDSSGNVYVTGVSGQTWGSPVRAYTGNDAFAAKLDSNGNLTWNSFLGGSGADYSYSIAVDSSGNVYVGGRSTATWQGDSAPVRSFSGSERDVFAAKLNSSGTLLWNTFLGGNGPDDGASIAVDSSGNVYVSGMSSGSTAWQGDSPPVQSQKSYYDVFAAKLNSSGVLTWNTFMGGSASKSAGSIAVDGSGNVYVGGYSDGTWGSPVRAYSSGYDAFAAKLDSSGNLTWNTFLGGSGTDYIANNYGNDIAVDSSGNVYVTGTSDASWGDTPKRAYSSGNDAFAAKLNSSGVLQWNTFLGGSGTDHGYVTAVDGSGNVYVAGYSNIGWGSPVRSFSGWDAFAAKLDKNGNFQPGWASYNDSSRTQADDTFASPETTVYVKGTSIANVSYLIAYYDASGAKRGSETVSASGGTLNSAYLLNSDGSAAAGTWHALVQPSSGYTGFGTDSYSTITSSPGTYGVIADDSFTVEASAIPEFPTVMAGVAVAGACFGIYWWMREKSSKVKM